MGISPTRIGKITSDKDTSVEHEQCVRIEKALKIAVFECNTNDLESIPPRNNAIEVLSNKVFLAGASRLIEIPAALGQISIEIRIVNWVPPAVSAPMTHVACIMVAFRLRLLDRLDFLAGEKRSDCCQHIALLVGLT
ncbi:hypothetical protein [Erythrobacter westpacificensis]|uniref:hypothetical protein n=1 Tax=Erythrobacter westpacificensis TaxID=1055231 RepID=UPI0031F96138